MKLFGSWESFQGEFKEQHDLTGITCSFFNHPILLHSCNLIYVSQIQSTRL